jgi:hypothetical protein
LQVVRKKVFKGERLYLKNDPAFLLYILDVQKTSKYLTSIKYIIKKILNKKKLCKIKDP